MPANPNRQVTWRDAQDWVNDFRKSWGKYVVFQLTCDPKEGAVHTWWVRLLVVSDLGKIWTMPDYARSEPFPNTNAGSVPGLMMYMINEAEKEFTRRATVAERQSSF